MATQEDPWVSVKTINGFAADQVISALQKEIRRGNTENAVLLAYEMLSTSPELEAYLWYRLQVVSVEDVGFGNLTAPILINSLHQMLATFTQDMGERILFAVHAVRYLCESEKDRSSDEMTIWVKQVVAQGKVLPHIPDYALDMHTQAGQDMGRGKRHFFEEAASLNPELPDRNLAYRNRIMKMLEEGTLD
jgi:replication-associated recombination protein RarA